MEIKDYIKNAALSKKEKNFLFDLLPEDSELTFIKGGGYWIYERKIDSKMVNKFLRLCALRESSFSSDKYKSFTINETGKFFIKTGFTWTHKDLL